MYDHVHHGSAKAEYSEVPSSSSPIARGVIDWRSAIVTVACSGCAGVASLLENRGGVGGEGGERAGDGVRYNNVLESQCSVPLCCADEKRFP